MHTCRPDINLIADLRITSLWASHLTFWRLIVKGSSAWRRELHTVATSDIEEFRKPEIGDLDGAVVVKQDVGGLEVVVDDVIC